VSNPAIFTIVSTKNKDGFFVIRDIGYNNQLSVTNDAEGVVQGLIFDKELAPGQRLLYYDTDGNLDELKIKDGKFAGFAPGPGR